MLQNLDENSGGKSVVTSGIDAPDYYNGLSLTYFYRRVTRVLRRPPAAFPYVLVLPAALFFILCSPGFSAELSLSNPTANPGQTVAVPLQLTAQGQAIAGIQLDLQWDQSLSVQVTPGVIVGQAFKILYASSPASGMTRCLISGINQLPLPDGVMLELFVTVNANAAPGTAQVQATNIFATSVVGDLVTVQPVSATVQIASGVNQTLPVESVLNGASLLSGPVAPGEIVSLFGSFSQALPAVLFNGLPAPVIYAGGGQVNAVVPLEIDLGGPVDLEIRRPDQSIAGQSIPVSPVAPAIFTQTSAGTGPGAILNEDYSPNSFLNPAAADSVVSVFGTGFGLTETPLDDGQTVSGANSLTLQVLATVGGVPAEVLYAGAAPSLIAGVTQINVRIPKGLPANAYTPITLSVGMAATQPGVTVSIR